MFRFALVSRDDGALGAVVFAEQLQPGDLVPLDRHRTMRVVNVIPADSDDEYAPLYVELLERSAGGGSSFG